MKKSFQFSVGLRFSYSPTFETLHFDSKLDDLVTNYISYLTDKDTIRLKKYLRRLLKRESKKKRSQNL